MPKRIFFVKYESAGQFPDRRVKLDVHFRDSEGNTYVWTPDWERGTRQLFLEAYQVERLNVPTGPERTRFEQVAQQVVAEDEKSTPEKNFRLIATRLGEALKYETSINQIERVASAIFDFEVSEHPHPAITSSRSQSVYSWVMTLAERRITQWQKLHLLREFICELTPEDSPARRLVP